MGRIQEERFCEGFCIVWRVSVAIWAAPIGRGRLLRACALSAADGGFCWGSDGFRCRPEIDAGPGAKGGGTVRERVGADRGEGFFEFGDDAAGVFGGESAACVG